MTALLYDLIFMLPLGMIAVFFGGFFGILPGGAVPPYIAMLLALSVCLSFKHLSDRRKYILPGLLLAFLLGALLIIDREKRAELFTENLWILWAVLITVSVYTAGRLTILYASVRRALMIADILFLAVLLFAGQKLEKWVPLPMLWLLAVSLIQEVEGRWTRSGDTDHKGHLVTVLPFPILLCLIVFLLPASDSPYDWNFAVKLWERAESTVKHVVSFFQGEKEEYDAQIGFSEEGAFWENISAAPRELMKITSDYSADSMIYLRGKSFDAFDGRNWISAFQGTDRDLMIDLTETACAALSRGERAFSDYMKKSQQRIRFLDFSTSYLFVPLKTEIADGMIDQILLQENTADLLAQKSLSYDDEYAFSNYRLNQEHEAFGELAASVSVPSGEEWDAAWEYISPPFFKQSKDNGDDRDVWKPAYTDYLAYRQRICQAYCPETVISERSSKLLEDLLAEASSDYERLVLLEHFLSAYTYTTSPGLLPEDVTDPEAFLDYLLFDSCRGYCSHFATAFVIAARYLGIPARYVQGYAVPVERAGEITVTSAMAHAWPEAYIDGLGWISFEPTPGKKRAARWMVQADYDAQKSQYAPDLYEYGRGDENSGLSEEKTAPRAPFDLKKVLLPILFGALFLLLFFIGDHVFCAWRYRRQSDTEKFRIRCRRNMKLLRYLGYVTAQGETLEEFRSRAVPGLSEQALAFTKAMELHLYAELSPDAQTIWIAEASEEILWEHLREKKGRRGLLYRIGLTL